MVWILAFQHGEITHDLKAEGQDLFILAQCVRSDGDLVTLLDEGDVHYCGHAVRLYSSFWTPVGLIPVAFAVVALMAQDLKVINI